MCVIICIKRVGSCKRRSFVVLRDLIHGWAAITLNDNRVEKAEQFSVPRNGVMSNVILTGLRLPQFHLLALSISFCSILITIPRSNCPCVDFSATAFFSLPHESTFHLSRELQHSESNVMCIIDA